MSVAVVKFSIVESDLSRIYSDKVWSRWVVWYKSLFGTHTQSQTHRQVVNYVLDNDAAGFHLSVTDSMQSALQPLITRTLIENPNYNYFRFSCRRLYFRHKMMSIGYKIAAVQTEVP